MGSLDTTGHLIVNSCTGCGPGGGNLFPGGAYQLVNYGATGGTNGYPDNYVTSSPGLFLSTASGGIQSYGGFTSGGGSPASNGVLTLDSTSAGVVNGGWSLTPSPTFTPPGYGWYLPDADAAGCLQSPGGGTPGSPSQLSLGPCAGGTGTINQIPKWTGSQTQGNSDFGNFVSNRLNCAGSGCTATYGGDQDNAGNNALLGSVIMRGADQGSAAGSASVAGQVYIHGGNNAAISGGTAGSAEIAAGENTGGANPGLLTAVQAYTWSLTSPTQYYLQCPSSVGAKAVGDCGALPGNWIGVAKSVSSRAVDVIVPPFEAPIAASAGVTLGHTVCAGPTAGEVTDSGGTAPCSSVQGTTVGVVEDIGSATYYFGDGSSFTTSPTLPLVTMNTATLASQAAISVPTIEFNGTPATAVADLNGTTPPAESNYILGKWQSSVSGTTTSASVEVPYGSASLFGVVKVDNSTITATNGVISAVGSGLTSVGLTAPPDLFTVGNSPLISNGTITQSKTTVGTGTVLRGPAPSTYATPYIVQTGTCITAQLLNNWPCIFPGAVAAGDALVAVGSLCYDCGGSDTGGPTWTFMDNAGGGSGDTFINLHQGGVGSDSDHLFSMVSAAIGGSTTVTLSETGMTITGGHVGVINIVELANTASVPFDAYAQGTGCNGSVPVTTIFAVDYVLQLCQAIHAATPPLVAGPGWGLVDNFAQSSPGPSATGAVGLPVTSVGTYTPVMSGGDGTRRGYTVALKGKAAGGPSTWFLGPLDVTFVPELFPEMAGQTGITVSGVSCTVKAIVDGLITSATCP
jgi:hypothetical protein